MALFLYITMAIIAALSAYIYLYALSPPSSATAPHEYRLTLLDPSPATESPLS